VNDDVLLWMLARVPGLKMPTVVQVKQGVRRSHVVPLRAGPLSFSLREQAVPRCASAYW
jgi:hypothetical protein